MTPNAEQCTIPFEDNEENSTTLQQTTETRALIVPYAGLQTVLREP